MIVNIFTRRNVVIAAVLVLALSATAVLWATDNDAPKNDAPKTDTPKPTDKPAKADDKKPAKDDAPSFKVPDGSADKLIEFIDHVQQMRPKKTSDREEVIKFIKDSRNAMLDAADKILAAKPTGKQRAKAMLTKFEALSLLDRLDPTGETGQKRDKLVDAMGTDSEPEVVRISKQIALSQEVQQLEPGDLAAARKVWAHMKALFADDPENPQSGELAEMITSALEHFDRDPDSPFTLQLFTDYKDMLGKSKLPENAARKERAEAVVRRLSLVGKTLDIHGTLVDGKKFDPATLKGKVVLLDFWATWCGPCLAELPNVKANYKKYHDKGFEVVSVNLNDDEQEEQLREFLDKRPLPWPVIFEADAKKRGFDNPMARYYGVSSIPTVILTNQKGEVVSINARGPALGEKLEELLGDGKDKPADKPTADKKKAAEE